MATEQRAAHSPLGASGAERWMNCVGSVALLKQLSITDVSDEPEYRSLGTSAHGAARVCLENNQDAWEVAGQTFGKHVVDQEMALAVQFYLDECAKDADEDDLVFIEFGIDYPEFHKDFYGTLDFGRVKKLAKLLKVKDFKYGEGLAVDVEWNPQMMYYAFGLLRHHPEVETVELTIVQPRAFHVDGPVRTWTVSADTIRSWAEETLKGAMNATALDHDLDAGKWCRFCPAKIVCPLMWNLFGAAMQTDPQQVITLSSDLLGKSYHYLDALEFFVKAFKDETFRRLNSGHKIEGVKLVAKKSNRVFKAGANQVFVPAYGSEAYTKPELKSPAEMAKLGADAKKLVEEWAYKPDTGLTVASINDKRPEVTIKVPQETFAAALEALDKPAEAG